MLEPVVKALGYELVDLDVRPGRNGLLRVYIERATGEGHEQADGQFAEDGVLADEQAGLEAAEGGVTLGDCELVSGQLSAFLDVEDPLPGSYVLEVSSPGTDRRLRTKGHFERFAGSEVKIELKRADQGRRRFRGRLTGIEGDEVLLEADGESWRFPLADIAEARLVPRDWLPGARGG
ncbi:MAG TPA: ribosome maturation factor RimP [Gammaproteobacteria bacterium]|nr:ribosome maturation factor RimP [Gammaproteobacteria bacterium]